MYRALCARSQKLFAGGSAPAPWVTFSCLSKRKSPKRRTPRSARPLPPFLAPPGARQLAGRTLRASGSNTGSLKSSRWGCGTRRALREPEKYQTGVGCAERQRSAPNTPHGAQRSAFAHHTNCIDFLAAHRHVLYCMLYGIAAFSCSNLNE